MSVCSQIISVSETQPAGHTSVYVYLCFIGICEWSINVWYNHVIHSYFAGINPCSNPQLIRVNCDTKLRSKVAFLFRPRSDVINFRNFIFFPMFLETIPPAWPRLVRVLRIEPALARCSWHACECGQDVVWSWSPDTRPLGSLCRHKTKISLLCAQQMPLVCPWTII